MDKIVINTTDLRDSANDLKLIDEEFTNCDNNADEFSKVVGHDGLGDKLNDFANRWEKHRNDMKGKIEELQKILNQGADEIEKTDRDLAKNLQVTGTPTGKKGGPQ